MVPKSKSSKLSEEKAKQEREVRGQVNSFVRIFACFDDVQRQGGEKGPSESPSVEKERIDEC